MRAALAEFGDRWWWPTTTTPKQVVLSGPDEAIARVEALLSRKGMTAKRLPVSTAFHSPLVARSGATFRGFLAGWRSRAGRGGSPTPRPRPTPRTPGGMRERLAGQIARPVRFVEQVEAMWARGARTFIEVGPGAVLTDLVGRILGGAPTSAFRLDRKGKHGVTSLQGGLGRLAVAGVSMNLAAPSDYAPRRRPRRSPR
ncbi:MAG: hypothetical protein IPN17_23380 [Deltaproteobacteria bacterium]|nr:hypothetical protein [Deltaproteobacteria bacterium]